jgi:hypothetical protein|nr:MAG TPA: hypothetical protein [Caudoviricetes sp.]
MTNEELEQEVKRLEEQLIELRIKILDSKGVLIPYKPYEVEYPKNLEDYYNPDEFGVIDLLEDFSTAYRENCYIRGLAFKTREEAELYDKKRILINKMEEWAKEHQGNWTPNWKDDDETIHEVQIDRFPMYGCDSPLVINEVEEVRSVSIFPYFYSYETARKFIDEFRGEIEEVLL